MKKLQYFFAFCMAIFAIVPHASFSDNLNGKYCLTTNTSSCTSCAAGSSNCALRWSGTIPAALATSNGYTTSSAENPTMDNGKPKLTKPLMPAGTAANGHIPQFKAVYEPAVVSIVYFCDENNLTNPPMQHSATYGSSYTFWDNTCPIVADPGIGRDPNGCYQCQKTGYELVGWQCPAINNSATISAGTTFNPVTFTQNAECFGVWRAITYNITYMDGVNDITNNFNQSYRSYAVDQFPKALPTYSKTGYTCQWYDNPSFTGSAVTQITSGTGDKTFYAKCTPENYNVIFGCGVAQGNPTGNNTSMPATYDVQFTYPNDANWCQNPGYVLDYWHCERVGEDEDVQPGTQIIWQYTLGGGWCQAVWRQDTWYVSYRCPVNLDQIYNPDSSPEPNGGPFNGIENEVDIKDLIKNMIKVENGDWAFVSSFPVNGVVYGSSVNLKENYQNSNYNTRRKGDYFAQTAGNHEVSGDGSVIMATPCACNNTKECYNDKVTFENWYCGVYDTSLSDPRQSQVDGIVLPVSVAKSGCPVKGKDSLKTPASYKGIYAIDNAFRSQNPGFSCVSGRPEICSEGANYVAVPENSSLNVNGLKKYSLMCAPTNYAVGTVAVKYYTGTCDGNNQPISQNVDVHPKQQLGVPSTYPTRPGYIFNGWYQSDTVPSCS